MDTQQNGAPHSSFFSQRLVILAGAVLLLLLIPTIAFISNQSKQKKEEAPKVTTTVVEPIPSPTPNELQKGPFFCPSIPEFCQKGEDIILANAYQGMGAVLPEKSPIYAAFDGELQVVQPSDSKYPLKVYLADNANMLRAGYIFYGTATGTKSVKKGEIIGTTTGKPLDLYMDKSLVFVLTRNDPTDGSDLQGIRYELKLNDFSK